VLCTINVFILHILTKIERNVKDMDIQDRYDEIDNLIITIDCLQREINSKDIREDLDVLKYNYMDEKDELLVKLNKMWDEEEKALENEFNAQRL